MRDLSNYIEKLPRLPPTLFICSKWGGCCFFLARPDCSPALGTSNILDAGRHVTASATTGWQHWQFKSNIKRPVSHCQLMSADVSCHLLHCWPTSPLTLPAGHGSIITCRGDTLRDPSDKYYTLKSFSCLWTAWNVFFYVKHTLCLSEAYTMRRKTLPPRTRSIRAPAKWIFIRLQRRFSEVFRQSTSHYRFKPTYTDRQE